MRQRKGRSIVFAFSKKTTEIHAPQLVDEIESAVYAHVKPYGFKKYGRTLHRFVSEDISQVIHFQIDTERFCVNLGIRIPECFERVFQPKEEMKKYYREHECTIRSRLGTVSGKRETWYDLCGKSDRITKNIIDELDQYVLPAYEVLNSRESILQHRKEYPLLDNVSHHLVDLEECMIYGHLGNIEKAKQLFERYYQSAVENYNELVKNGRKQYLKKGERIVFMGQDITAEKDGYVTLYGASHGHIDYLDELAVNLGFR